MPRRFKAGRIKQTRSRKQTATFAKSVMGDGTRIESLPTDRLLAQERENDPVYHSQRKLGGSVGGPEPVIPLFDLPAQDSLTPISGTTPTFTRATTKTGTNFDGQVFTGLSGEPVFEGARRVENLITASEDMTNAAYTLDSGVTSTTTTVTFTGAASDFISQNVTIVDDGSGVGGRTFVYAPYISLVSGTISGNTSVRLGIEGNAMTAGASTNIGSSITSTPKRFSHAVSTDAAGTVVQPILRCDDAATLAVTWQLEEVTGQTNQNPSEYVSTGVGTGAELVTNGSWDDGKTGWNEEGSGNTFTVLGGVATLTRGSGEQTVADQAFTTVVGKAYAVELVGAGNGTTARVSLRFSNTSFFGSPILSLISATSTTTQNIYGMFTATTTTTHISVGVNGGVGTVTADNISVKEASHGANIDGVKYFLHTNPNTVNGGVVTSDEAHWLELDGNSGSYASTPDSEAASISSDITLIACVSADDWTPSTNGSLVTKWTTAGDKKGYDFQLRTTGVLKLFLSNDGAAEASAESSVVTGFADGTGHWVKVSWSESESAANFYTSDQPAGTLLSELNWEQLGAADVALSMAGIFSNGQPFTVGANNVGTGNNFSGTVHRAVAIPSTDPTATPVVDFTPETAIADGWTIHSTGTAQIKTNKALTFTEERTGPIALSTPLAVNDGFNASTSLYGAVEAFPNLLPPAARVDFDEWTQTGTGSITPVGDGVEGVTQTFSAYAATVGDYSDLGAGVARLAVTTGASARIWQNISLTKGAWNLVTFDVDAIGGANASLSIDKSLGGPVGSGDLHWSPSLGQGIHNFLFWSDVSDASLSIFVNSATNGTSIDFNYATTSIKPYSHTTLSDEDDSANEALWDYTQAIPSDDQSYKLGLTLARGTATQTSFGLEFSGASTKTNLYTFDWVTEALTQDSGESDDVSATVSVIGILDTAGRDIRTATIALSATDASANTAAKVKIYPASTAASVQGTVSVVGVDLNRVSVAAEPTWNTLRPGDSVEQKVLQQQDYDTTWRTAAGTPILTQNQTDIFGNANTAWSIEDNESGVVSRIYQGITGLDADGAGQPFCLSIWVHKESSVAGYPAITFAIGSGGGTLLFDPVNGQVINRGSDFSGAGCVDGAIIKAMLPQYSNADNYWLFWGSNANDNLETTTDINVWPAYRTDFTDAGSQTAAVNILRFDMITVNIGAYPFFFDSITTTAKVTEVIQDWSKIFSYSTEADDNVANIVFDHNYLEGAGVNIEGARTNLQSYSAEFDNVAYTELETTTVPNSAVAPDGTLTAYLFDVSIATAGHRHFNISTYSTSTGTDYTASFYLKDSGVQYMQIRHYWDVNDWTAVVYDLVNGTVTDTASGSGTSTLSDSGIEAVGDGWYRCWAAAQDSSLVALYSILDSSNSATPSRTAGGGVISYTGVAGEDAYFWGKQVEAGSFPSSYIKTEASSVTRNADVLSYSAVGVADTFPMTVSVDYVPSQITAGARVVDINDGSTTDRVVLSGQTTGKMRGFTSSASATVALIDSTADLVVGVPESFALAVALNDVEMYSNGATTGTPDTSAALPVDAMTVINVGSDSAGGIQPYGNIRNVKIFDKRLTDAEVSKL